MIFAGPCSLTTNRDAMIALARSLKARGAYAFRCKFRVGGSVAPPLGMADPLWGPMDQAKETLSEISKFMPVACELRAGHVPVCEVLEAWPQVDYWWIPARQMQAYETVREAASYLKDTDKTLLIKRAPYARMRDVLGIISHVRDCGYPLDELIVVERGIVTYDHEGNWPVDLDAMFIADMKRECPDVDVMVDATHAVGLRARVADAARIGKAAGAAHLMVEVWGGPDPSLSPTDPALAISIEEFETIEEQWDLL